jgi:hypothetical protein
MFQHTKKKLMHAVKNPGNIEKKEVIPCKIHKKKSRI